MSVTVHRGTGNVGAWLSGEVIGREGADLVYNGRAVAVNAPLVIVVRPSVSCHEQIDYESCNVLSVAEIVH